MGSERVIGVKHCSICGRFFRPSPQQGDRQACCNRPECQKERKRRSQRAWSLSNPDYFKQRYPHTKAWREKNPAYQREWRKKKREIQDAIGSLRKRANFNAFRKLMMS